MKKIKNLKELANRIATEFDPLVKEAAMNTLQTEIFRKAKPVNWDNVSGVYVLFDGDELVYVGQTKNVHTRISEHMREKMKIFTHYAFLPFPAGERLEVERALIALFKPKYHRVMLADLGFVNRYDLEKAFGLNFWDVHKIVNAHNVPCAPCNMVHAETFAEAVGKPLPVKEVVSDQDRLF